MRQIVSLIALLCVGVATSVGVACGQNSSSSNIPLMVVIPTQVEEIPQGAVSALQNKMNQVITASSIGSFNQYAQFCLLVNVDKESNNIVAGAPPMFAQTLNFTFNIVDQFNMNILETTSVTAKGVGTNQTKAYIQAIKQLNVQSPMLKNFIAQGREKIVEYYIANCDKIIAKANSLAGMKQFEEALFQLTQIPDVCGDCYTKALRASGVIFQQYVDDLCVRNLAMAKSVWAANQNAEGATAAGEYLQNIYPDAECYGDAQLLHKEIKSKVAADWKFEMKIYQDGVNLETQRIKAIRDIGVAFGRGQKPITYAPTVLVR